MSVARFPTLAHWGAYTALVENGRVIGCEPFARDPAPSNMLEAIPAMVHSPLRIARPAIREGWRQRKERTGSERFHEVSWDEALSAVAEELARVREEFGNTAILGGSYGWSSAGRVHHARSLLRRFLFLGGGCVDQVANYSFGAAQYILPRVIGTFQPVVGDVTDWSSIVKHTRLMIAFGGLALKNAQVTSGGAGVHSLETWLRRAKDAGMEFVSISPLRSDAPGFVAAQWVPIRPNTDTALMLGMAHTLLTEGRYDVQFVSRYCTGFETFRRYLLGLDDGVAKNADWAAAITGVPAETICDLARRAAATPTMITCAWSLQRAHHGEQPYWAAIMLASMLGGIGLPGTGFAFGHGSTNGIGVPRVDVAGPELPLPLNPARSMIPVARIADMLLAPGESYAFNGRRYAYPDIRLVYWAGGNPFHHHQDLNRLRRAWQKPQTVIVHDSWWTPTVRTSPSRRATASFLPCTAPSIPSARPATTSTFSALWRSVSAMRMHSPKAATRWAGANGSMTRCERAPRQRGCRYPDSSSSGRRDSSSCRRPSATMSCSRISVAIPSATRSRLHPGASRSSPMPWPPLIMPTVRRTLLGSRRRNGWAAPRRNAGRFIS
jgi:biotin/methionine sulfoxide reductase